MRVQFEVIGERATVQTVRDLGQFDWSQFHRRAAIYMQRSIRQGVYSGKDLDGRPFAPLSIVTQQAKRGSKRRGSAHILVDRGDMLKSLIPSSNAREGRVAIGDRMNQIKGRAHNFGTRNMPRRSWFGIRKADIEVIEGMAGDAQRRVS